jgi:tetratricopeptide (TPR) repeat protein
MTSSNFFLNLQQKIGSKERPWLIFALRQDPWVWRLLNTTGLGKTALEELPPQAEAWTPATLALLDMRYPSLADVLQRQPMETIAHPIRRMAQRAYRDWREHPQDNLTMGQIGLMALALREQRIKSSWQELWIQVMSDLEADQRAARSVLACLYGMVPESDEMLYSLLSHPETSLAVSLGLNAFLSNPLPPDIQVETLSVLIQRLGMAARFMALRLLAAQRPLLIERLAPFIWGDAGTTAELLDRALLETDQTSGVLCDYQADFGERSNHLNLISALFQVIEAYAISEQPSQAMPLLEKAIHATRRLQANLSMQLGQMGMQSGQSEGAVEAWKQSAQLAPDSSYYAAGLTQALLEAGRIEDAQAYLQTKQKEDELPPDSHLLFSEALIAFRLGEKERAADKAKQAFDQRGSQQSWNDFSRLARLLSELDLHQEAAQAAEFALQARPYDVELLVLQVKSSLAVNRPEQALEAAQVASMLAPEIHDIKLLLVECLEAAGEWGAALAEREKILAVRETPNVSDLRALANCAIRAGEPARAVQACEKAIELAPDDGLAYGLLGKAYANLDDGEAAMQNFHMATQLAPHQPDPWLSLAYAYHQGGDTPKALEVLSAGSQAAQDSPEIHLALGEAYLAENAPTHALAPLRKAAELVRSDSFIQAREKSKDGRAVKLIARIGLNLGQTLHHLGHLDEARQVLEEAYAVAPMQVDLAYAYAQILVAMQEDSKALQPLETVIQAQPEEAAPYLEYARIILEFQGELESTGRRAVRLLKHVLNQEQYPDEAIAHYAEALACAGEMREAKDAFQQALDTELAKQPEWKSRLSQGLGKVTLALNEFEMAIAALQEAASSDPDNAEIQCVLSEAFLAAGLGEDAYRTACEALQLQPSDLKTLTWFADHILSFPEKTRGVQRYAEAIQALEHAIEIAPNRSRLYVRLGELQVENDDRESAQETFNKIAGIDVAKATAYNDLSARDLKQDFYRAAQNLRSLGDLQGAIGLLKRAIDIQRSLEAQEGRKVGEIDQVTLLVELSLAYRQIGNLAEALLHIDRTLPLKANDSQLYLIKADLLYEMNELDEALICIRDALQFATPNDREEDLFILHYRAAQILRALGNLPQALKHAQKATLLESPLSCSGRLLAADLARAMLDPDLAHEILTEWKPSEKSPEYMDYFWMYMELALDAGEDAEAAQALEVVQNLVPHHPRSLVGQTRLTARQGDHPTAVRLLGMALEAIQPETEDELNTLRAISAAAVEIAQWTPGISLLEKICQLASKEPLSHLQLAKALVQRAEAQRLCQSLDVVKHAPGESAVSLEAYQAYESALVETGRLLETWSSAEQADEQPAEKIESQDQEAGPADSVPFGKRLSSLIHPRLARWYARGLTAFYPTQQSVEAIQTMQDAPRGPDIVAALVETMGYLGEQDAAKKAAQSYPQHPWVLLKLALAMADHNPRQSLGIAHTAVEYLSQRSYERPHETPMRHYMLARLAHQAGDHATALESIQQALLEWPDEPRWHAMAAQIHLAAYSSDHSKQIAIQHLEEALRLEPAYNQHYIDLGKLYLECDQLTQAIQTLEEATEIPPELDEPWLLLARAYLISGNLAKATTSADQAVERSGKSRETVLLRAEIALENNDPQGAQSRAQAVLERFPDDSRALGLMAKALEALNQLEQAIAHLEKAILLVDKPLPLLLERARLLRNFQGQEAALETLQEIASHYPHQPAVRAALAEALMEAGQNESAVKLARQTLHDLPDELQADLCARMHLLLGRHFRQAGQLDQAVHHLNQSVQSMPDHVDAYLELGKTHQDRRQFAEALKIYQQAIGVAQDDPRPYYQAGVVLKESKDYLGAETMLRRAADIAPNDVAVHRMLGAVVALNLVHNRHPAPVNP